MKLKRKPKNKKENGVFKFLSDQNLILIRQRPKEHSRVLREFLKVVVFIDGVMHSQVDQLLQGLVDEDDADESSESFLSEACDVADKRAGIRGHQQ